MIMRARCTLIVLAAACSLVLASAPTASAQERAYFESGCCKNLPFYVSGTPRSTLYEEGAEHEYTVDEFEFCTAAQLNSNGSLQDFACTTQPDWWTSFPSTEARAWLKIAWGTGYHSAVWYGYEWW
jgi:hypothetical protein